MAGIGLSDLGSLVGDTLRAPRETFARLSAWRLSVPVLSQALLLVVVLSVLLAELSNLMVSYLHPPGVGVMLLSPMFFGALQLALLVGMLFAILLVGRALGGHGDLAGSILLVSWLQFIMVCVQLVQSAALLLVPSLAWAIGVGGLVLFLWLLTNFIAELHGFTALGRVFAMILFTMLGVALGLSFVLALFGVTVPA
ncbi:Yip1 family protein [Profundibacterium mesophilum]|uniref:Yip1 domain containing protein n=1 Tax=Profundibacterium mesophilum KAUST100406-0324 TaxID=1037889 RepID=A0A921NT49_9RHOB|nr:Yip1 family protein [Profundibacterium mesophilum]KAF0675040.1 Yip1 domain containing protein [Profundibacterium mesophilum KAUST100406-0324]